MWEPTRRENRGRPPLVGEAERREHPSGPTGVMAMACMYRGDRRNTGSPMEWLGSVPGQPVTRERRTGLDGVAERAIVLRKPGNAGGGKGPWSETSAGQGRARRGLAMSLATPPKIEKLQKALHAKAKEEPEFRFYQLHDKVYREDILAHAYALSAVRTAAQRGWMEKTFEAIESQGREGWLGELRQELKEKRLSGRPGAPGVDSRKRTVGNARSASRRSGIGWCRWRRCWSWSRSSRLTFSLSNTPTARVAARLDAVRRVHRAGLRRSPRGRLRRT